MTDIGDKRGEKRLKTDAAVMSTYGPNDCVNFTPHSVTLIAEDGNEIHYGTSGVVLRAAAETSPPVEVVDGVRLRDPFNYSKLDGLDRAMSLIGDDKTPIVSEKCVALLQIVHTGPILVPDANPDSAVRDQKGQIVGVRFFTIYRR